MSSGSLQRVVSASSVRVRLFVTFFTLKIKNHIKNLELDKNFYFAFKINVFTSTLKLEKKIRGPSTFDLKLAKERRGKRASKYNLKK